MEGSNRFTLGESAEDFYKAHEGNRTGPVDIALSIAEVTIPSMFPPEDWQSGDDLPRTNQSVNAFALNTLASKLAAVALPPGLPMCKFSPIEHKLQGEIEQDPELWGEIVYSLSRREEAHRRRLETTGGRAALIQWIRLLIGTGNGCQDWRDINFPVIHNMHHYVVRRSSKGEPLTTVLKEVTKVRALPADVQDVIYRNDPELRKKPLWEQEVDVYTVCNLEDDPDSDGKEWVAWQEVDGEYIPGTESFAPFEAPQLYPGWMVPVWGSNWGLPYCLDYLGDLTAVENYAASIQDGAAAAAFTVIFVDPTGLTQIGDVRKADNLDILAGRAADVTTLVSGKNGDLQVASTELEAATRRLSHAFLMMTAIQRSGERVTAEEITRLAQEIESALGGLYSEFANTTQKHFVRRFIFLHEEEDKSLAPLPKGLVEVGVVTGLDAQGRSSEGDRMVATLREAVELFGPDEVNKRVIVGEGIKRLFAARAVKTEGLVRDEEAVQQGDQERLAQAQQMELAAKAAPAIAKEGAAAVRENYAQPQQ